MKLSDFVIVVPAYNEEKNLPALFEDIRRYLGKAAVLLVDDGSPDKTAELGERFGAIVLRHGTNRGKGEALKTAFAYLKEKDYDKIIIMDADLQFSAKEVPKVIDALDLYSFVMGMRDWNKVPFRHRLGNKVWRVLFNLLYGTKLKDTNCGLMGFKRSIIDKLEVGGGYIIENMMLASAVKNDIMIGQVPVEVKYNVIHGLPRGARVVSGVFVFILKDGIKYRLSKLSK